MPKDATAYPVEQVDSPQQEAVDFNQQNEPENEANEMYEYRRLDYEAEALPELRTTQYLRELAESGLAERSLNDDPVNDNGILGDMQAQNEALKATVLAATGANTS